jgi:hypothetical protein
MQTSETKPWTKEEINSQHPKELQRNWQKGIHGCVAPNIGLLMIDFSRFHLSDCVREQCKSPCQINRIEHFDGSKTRISEHFTRHGNCKDVSNNDFL